MTKNSCKNSGNSSLVEEIPAKIVGTYNEDYNILYVHDIICRKLQQEKKTLLPRLRLQEKTLRTVIASPQNYISRVRALDSLAKIEEEILSIEEGKKTSLYHEKVEKIIEEYQKCGSRVKTVFFDDDPRNSYRDIDQRGRDRLYYIEKFLSVAQEYVDIDVARNNLRPANVCLDCSTSLANVIPNEEGMQLCPNCQTEHLSVILTKLAKDGPRINTVNTADDESIENFMRAFTRYQGLQSRDNIEKSLFRDLDAYFLRNERPTGEEIRKLPLNSRGKRGDTNHKMLWVALGAIGRPEYEDANLIGHLYWGWTLPNLSQYKEKIISDYLTTQRVFYQIPLEERDRTSSLGTQYRLWRHIQLVGYKCFMDEFKIAENSDSLKTHHRLWRMMCEGAGDPTIYYIN